MGTAITLTINIEYPNATKIDNRRALKVLSMSERIVPATKEVSTADKSPISQLNPKSRSLRDWPAKKRIARNSILA